MIQKYYSIALEYNSSNPESRIDASNATGILVKRGFDYQVRNKATSGSSVNVKINRMTLVSGAIMSNSPKEITDIVFEEEGFRKILDDLKNEGYMPRPRL